MEYKKFKIHSKYSPSGDQPKAIDELVRGIEDGDDAQTLLGITGSGKTFTIANVIERVQKPTLIIAHNKTLAAQLLVITITINLKLIFQGLIHILKSQLL